MAVSIIDGVIEDIEPGRKAAGIRFFKKIVFKLPDGGTKTVGKSVVHADLAGHFQPGASGRFYLFTALDHRGIHGFRDGKGGSWFAYPRNNETIALVMMVLIGLWVGYVLFAWAGLPIFWTLLLILNIFAFFHFRSVRTAARRQFEADGGHPAAAPAAAEPATT